VPGSKWREDISAGYPRYQDRIAFGERRFSRVAKNEIPPLLKAAKERACQILPIIVAACRFTKTSALAEFQAVNLSNRPLSAMNAHEREALCLRVADTIDTILQQRDS
jgi:hypothetical protein